MILHSYPEIVDVKSGDEKRKQVEKEEAKLLYIIVTIFNFGRLTVEIILYHHYIKHIVLPVLKKKKQKL